MTKLAHNFRRRELLRVTQKTGGLPKSSQISRQDSLQRVGGNLVRLEHGGILRPHKHKCALRCYEDPLPPAGHAVITVVSLAFSPSPARAALLGAQERRISSVRTEGC